MRKVGHGFIASFVSTTIVLLVIFVRYSVNKYINKSIDENDKQNISWTVFDVDYLFMQDLINCIYDNNEYLHGICLPVILDIIFVGSYTMVYLKSDKYDYVGVILKDDEYLNMYVTNKLNIESVAIDRIISSCITGDVTKYMIAE